MRALGPRSISSVLKIVLDVAYVALWIGLVVVIVLAPAALFFHFDLGFLLLQRRHHFPPIDAETRDRILAARLLFSAIYIAGVLVIIERLRRVFATLTAGDPFHPENVRRLQLIGAVLAGLELLRYPQALVFTWLTPDIGPNRGLPPNLAPNLAAWFGVVVVFVLAEVFREGARLRREAELTI